jgi:hypothetical protein
MMPESANPVQQPQTIIEIRPYRGGWQCFEAPRRTTRIGQWSVSSQFGPLSRDA